MTQDEEAKLTQNEKLCLLYAGKIQQNAVALNNWENVLRGPDTKTASPEFRAHAEKQVLDAIKHLRFLLDKFESARHAAGHEGPPSLY